MKLWIALLTSALLAACASYSGSGLKPSEARLEDVQSLMGPLAMRWQEADGSVQLAYCIHARDLHLVMGPAAKGASVRLLVLIDGQPPGAAHGTDVDEQGNGIVTDQRLYQLIRQPKAIVDRQFEIDFLDSSAEAFAFTFG